MNVNSEVMKKSDGESVFHRLEMGENKFRIVSGVQGVKEHKLETENGWRFPVCPTAQKTWENETNGTNEDVPVCPICASGATDVRVQYFALAINRETGKLGILKSGKMIFKQVIRLLEDEDSNNLKDNDIKIIRTGEKLTTKYDVDVVLKATKITAEEKKMIEETEIDLDKMCIPNDFDKLVEIAGLDPETAKKVSEGQIPF